MCNRNDVEEFECSSHACLTADRGDDLIRGPNGTGVVWDVDIEGGVHLFIRVISGRVLYHCDVVAKLSGVANSGLHTRVCDETNDDQPVDPAFFQLQIQISVGKAA